MRLNKSLLTILFLLTTTASIYGQQGATPAIPSGSQRTSSALDSPADDPQELRDQQQILAELVKQRGENKALKDERDALKGQLAIANRLIEVEQERAGFYKVAAEKGLKIDSNAGLIAENLRTENKVCMAQVGDLERENDKLRSSRNWRTVIGFGAGAAAGAYAARK